MKLERLAYGQRNRYTYIVIWHDITSVPIGAWKGDVPQEIMTDHPTNRQTDRPGHRKVSIPRRNVGLSVDEMKMKNDRNHDED